MNENGMDLSKRINKLDLSKCKTKYIYLRDEHNKPYDTVCNKGLKKYEKAYVSRNGEYHEFCVEAQEDIPSILTNYHIEKALKFILNKNLSKTALALNIYTIYQKIQFNSLLSEQLLYYVIDKWLIKNNFDPLFKNNYDINIFEKELLRNNKNIKIYVDNYIGMQRHHPIAGKIKIINIGSNTKTKEPVGSTRMVK